MRFRIRKSLCSERNSEALNASDNSDFGAVSQDDYDAWVGEAALVRWGSGTFRDQAGFDTIGTGTAANYIYTDGHVEWMN